jgi:hypothetical protein
LPIALGTAAAGVGTLGSKDDHVHPTTGVGLTANPLSQFATTTSAQLAGVISDETGSGVVVFNASPTLTPATVANVGLTVQALASQTADLLQIQDSGGTARASFERGGALSVQPSTAVNGYTGFFKNPSSSVIAIIAKGAASQTANLQEWQNSAGSILAQVNASGAASFGGNNTLSASIGVGVGGSPTQKGIVVKAAASQTANLQEWQDSAGTVLAKVDAGGKLTTTSVYTAKTASYTFASGDEGNMFSMNNAATQQFNIPTDATFNFAVGTEINVFWITGAGQPTIGAVTPGTTTVISTGATSATPKLRVANSGATCKKIAANSWIIFGDLA